MDPNANSVDDGAVTRQLEPRAMEVLAYLSQRPGQVVPAEDILCACWGDSVIGDNALHKIVAQLRRALDDAAAAPRYIETIRKRGYRLLAQPVATAAAEWLHEPPFRGLEPFGERHAAIFCGRAAVTEQLLQAARRQADAGCAMLLVLGPSGAGKTSLIQAGLLPALRRAGSALPVCGVLQLDCADMARAAMLDTLASVLLDCEFDGRLVFSASSAAGLAGRLARQPEAVLEELVRQAAGRRLLLFIDRLEAIFRLPGADRAERERFIAVLERLARSGALLVVLACRNDFYPHLVGHAALMELKRRGGQLDVLAPGPAEIAQMIRQPAQMAQLSFDADPASGATLDELLCEAARSGPDALPLLQYCLQELYRQRGPGGELRMAVFQAMGGLEGAIGARAESLIEALDARQAEALPLVLSQLLVVSEDASTVAARRAPWSALATAEERELVKALVEARLFVSDLQGGAPAFGIAHEALLRRWPRVADWIAQHRATLQLRTRIAAQARRWHEAGRPRDLLLPAGLQVNQARQLLATPRFAFSAEERGFMQASTRAARRRETLRMLVLTLVLALAAVATLLGVAARSAQLREQQLRLEAEGLMSFMLGDFVDRLRPIGRLDLLDSVSNRALAYLTGPGHAAQADERPATLAQRARALQVISEVKIARAEPHQAETALQAGRAILARQLAAAPHAPALLKSAGENAFWLGQIRFDRRDWDGAAHYFLQYRDLSDRLAAAAPRDPDSWLELSYAHNSLGSVALQRGDLPAAIAAFTRSVALKERALAARPGHTTLISALADSLSWLASAQRRRGALHDADRLHGRAMGLLQQLHARAPADALWTSRLAAAWSHRGELRQALGDVDGSRAAYAQAAGLLREIVRHDPSNRVWQRNLYIAELRLFDLEWRAHPQAARKRLSGIQAGLRSLSAIDADAPETRGLLERAARREADLAALATPISHQRK